MKITICKDVIMPIGGGSSNKLPDYAWNKLLYRMGQRAMKQYGRDPTDV